MNTSYVILFLVMQENSFVSKGLMIHENQEVITTGPYSIVRHPMYISALIMAFSIPVTLGSLIGLIPSIFVPVIFVIRIRKEEEMLLRSNKGYDDYRKKVKDKLIPGIW